MRIRTLDGTEELLLLPLPLGFPFRQSLNQHPDLADGSNEKMSELHIAYKIARENHNTAKDKPAETKRPRGANAEYQKMQAQRSTKEDELGRTGGIHSARRVNVAREQNNKFRNAKELQSAYDTFQPETTDAVQRMTLRSEVAI